MPRRETIVEVQGRRLPLSNLEKVLYPEAGFTKREVIDYYIRVGAAILPHLAGRPLTLKRYPNGVAAGYFYQKNCPQSRPEWVETARIWSEGNHRWMDYCVVHDLASLIWAANLASLELHTSLSKSADMSHPSYAIFDLDPGEPAAMVECCKVGLGIRDALARAGLHCFAKTSGSKGLQVYAPLNSGASYEATKPFAHELAHALERQYPELVVSDMKKSIRTGKVLVDWSQNDLHKTTICVYSLRARPQPTVSTPVSWEEVTHCLRSGNPAALTFTAAQVLERVERQGDLFAPVLTLRQQMPGVPIAQMGTQAKAAIGSSKPLKATTVARKPTAGKPGAGEQHKTKPRTAPTPHRIKRAG